MKKEKTHIEIVRSIRPGLSSLSRASCKAIYTVLSRHYETVGVSIINSISDLEKLVAKQPDLAFMGMKYLPGDQPGSKLWIANYLKQHGIEHTGSSHGAIELERDKSLAKQRVLDAGLQTARFMVIRHGELPLPTPALRFPLFVKPVSRGGGQGIDDSSVVHHPTDLQAKLRLLANKYASEVLVEEYLSGREFSVAILRNEYTSELMVMPIELIARHNSRGDRILSQKVKSSNQETVRPVVEPLLRQQVKALALAVFEALDARDYGRIDIRLDAAGQPHFLEANLIPSLIDGYGSFPKACLLNTGLDYETMILSIVRLGLKRVQPITENKQALTLVAVSQPSLA